MENEKDTIEIDLLALVRAVWKKIWLVIAAVLVGAGIAFSYAKFMITPLYESKALMYVNNSSISVGSTSFSISSGELSAAQSLVKTYIVILQSRQTLNTVIETANLPYTYEQLVSKISASAVNETEIFEIKVTDTNPEEAELIANTIAEVLPDKISNIVEGSSVRIVDYAIVPVYPVSPSVTKYAMLGFLLGGIISVGVIVLMELFNESIRSDDYLIQTYGLPILAVIPTIDGESRTRSYELAYQNKTNLQRRKK